MVVSHNSANIFATGLLILASVILLNLGGYLFGFLIAKICGMSNKKSKTIAIGTGMQNSALACSLATTNFPSLAVATVPGAIFSVWQNILGAVLAYIFKNLDEKN